MAIHYNLRRRVRGSAFVLLISILGFQQHLRDNKAAMQPKLLLSESRAASRRVPLSSSSSSSLPSSINSWMLVPAGIKSIGLQHEERHHDVFEEDDENEKKDDEEEEGHWRRGGENVVVFGKAANEKNTYRVGRLENADIKLTGASCSRRHAIFRISDSSQKGGASSFSSSSHHQQQYTKITVTDLGTSSGTFLNDQRLSSLVERELCHGDVIRFGKGTSSTFTVKAPKSHPSATCHDPYLHRIQIEQEYAQKVVEKEKSRWFCKTKPLLLPKTSTKAAATATATTTTTTGFVEDSRIKTTTTTPAAARASAARIRTSAGAQRDYSISGLDAPAPSWGDKTSYPRDGRSYTLTSSSTTITSRSEKEEKEEEEEEEQQHIISKGTVLHIGRHPDCHVVLSHTSSSRLHAIISIRRLDKVLCIEDAGSARGTFLNKERIPPHIPTPLHPGDVLSFGVDKRKRYVLGLLLTHGEAEKEEEEEEILGRNMIKKNGEEEKKKMSRQTRLADRAVFITQSRAEMTSSIRHSSSSNNGKRNPAAAHTTATTTTTAKNEEFGRNAAMMGSSSSLSSKIKKTGRTGILEYEEEADDMDWRIMKYSNRLSTKQDAKATKALKLEAELNRARKEANTLIRKQAIYGGISYDQNHRLEELQKSIPLKEEQLECFVADLEESIEANRHKREKEKYRKGKQKQRGQGDLEIESSSSSSSSSSPTKEVSFVYGGRNQQRNRCGSTDTEESGSGSCSSSTSTSHQIYKDRMEKQMMIRNQYSRNLNTRYDDGQTDDQESKQHYNKGKKHGLKENKLDDLMYEREVLIFLEKQLNESLAIEAAAVMKAQQEQLLSPSSTTNLPASAEVAPAAIQSAALDNNDDDHHINNEEEEDHDVDPIDAYMNKIIVSSPTKESRGGRTAGTRARGGSNNTSTNTKLLKNIWKRLNDVKDKLNHTRNLLKTMDPLGFYSEAPELTRKIRIKAVGFDYTIEGKTGGNGGNSNTNFIDGDHRDDHHHRNDDLVESHSNSYVNRFWKRNNLLLQHSEMKQVPDENDEKKIVSEQRLLSHRYLEQTESALRLFRDSSIATATNQAATFVNNVDNERLMRNHQLHDPIKDHLNSRRIIRLNNAAAASKAGGGNEEEMQQCHSNQQKQRGEIYDRTGGAVVAAHQRNTTTSHTEGGGGGGGGVTLGTRIQPEQIVNDNYNNQQEIKGGLYIPKEMVDKYGPYPTGNDDDNNDDDDEGAIVGRIKNNNKMTGGAIIDDDDDEHVQEMDQEQQEQLRQQIEQELEILSRPFSNPTEREEQQSDNLPKADSSYFNEMPKKNEQKTTMGIGAATAAIQGKASSIVSDNRIAAAEMKMMKMEKEEEEEESAYLKFKSEYAEEDALLKTEIQTPEGLKGLGISSIKDILGMRLQPKIQLKSMHRELYDRSLRPDKHVYRHGLEDQEIYDQVFARPRR